MITNNKTKLVDEQWTGTTGYGHSTKSNAKPESKIWFHTTFGNNKTPLVSSRYIFTCNKKPLTYLHAFLLPIPARIRLLPDSLVD